MATCSIQSLTVLLCVVLILSTGAIIGGFTLSTWDDLLEKARDTGDEGFGMCLDSGTADIETVSARYLRSVLGNVDTAVLEYLKVPEQLMMSVVNLAKAHHPNVSTSPAFMDNIMRPALSSTFRAGYDAGVGFVAYESYPWSPAHPVPWKMSDGYAGWGSRCLLTHVTISAGITPTNGTAILLKLEMVDPVTLQPGQSDMLVLSEVDTVGALKYTSEPCNVRPDYNKGDVRGLCIYPVVMLEPPGSLTNLARGRELHNLGADDPPLLPAETIVYSAAMARWESMAWELSYTFTHPDMYTMHPKQGKRVGTVTSAVTTQGVTEVVRAQLLPTGTSLYMVEEDASGSVGTLVAYNRGRELRTVYEMSPLGIKLDLVYSINITNHSMEDATLHIPSVIAEHGRFAFTHLRNYRDLVDMTKTAFLKWSDSNGTEFWTITSTIEHGSIFWYSTLLVPRASVMETIDASTNAIRAKVASDLSSADAQKEDAVIVMVIVTAVAVIGLLAIAVVFTRYITSPLLKLGSEMASVAVMDLEAVDTGRAVSQLSEVGVMQRSFVTMVANLVEYRNYMPQSVLVNDTDKEEVSETDSAHDMKSQQSGISNSRASPSSAATMQAQKALLRVEGMKKKKVSLAHMNVASWHTFCKKHKDAEVLSAHAGVIERILTAVQHNKGVCDTFAGDRILATFNAFVPKPSHGAACVKAAHEVATALGDLHKISYGCTTGEARVGNMGCNGMKKMSILSQLMSWVVVLERWNRKNDLPGVVDRNVSRDTEGQVVLRCAGAVLFQKLSENVQTVFAVKGLCINENEEWMYQLESAANNPHALWNEVFEHIITQDFEQASSLLDTVAQDQRTPYEELVGYVEEKAYAPYVVDLH